MNLQMSKPLLLEPHISLYQNVKYLPTLLLYKKSTFLIYVIHLVNWNQNWWNTEEFRPWLERLSTLANIQAGNQPLFGCSIKQFERYDSGTSEPLWPVVEDMSFLPWTQASVPHLGRILSGKRWVWNWAARPGFFSCSNSPMRLWE